MEDIDSTSPAPEPTMPVPEVVVRLPDEPAPTSSQAPARSIYDDVDYEAMAEEHGSMSVSELRDIYPDAHRLVHQFGGLDLTEAAAIGNHPGVLRELARLGGDVRVGAHAEMTYRQQLPQGTHVAVKPLEGTALDQYIEQRIVKRLDAPTRSALETSGVLRTPAGQRFLQNIAQQLYRHEHLLPALRDQVEALPACQERQNEARALESRRPAVQAMAQTDFDAQYGSLVAQVAAADRERRLSDVARLTRELELLAKSRWGG